MLEFLVDNIFVVCGRKGFPTDKSSIPMSTNCATLLADICLYSYAAEFIQSLLSAGKKQLASQFNFTYRYIDDVLSINNLDFENTIWVRCIQLTLRKKHDGDQHLCLLVRFTPVNRERRSAAYFPLWYIRRFQLPYNKVSVPEKQQSIFARLWRFYVTARLVCQGLLDLWKWYYEGCATLN